MRILIIMEFDSSLLTDILVTEDDFVDGVTAALLAKREDNLLKGRVALEGWAKRTL